MSALYNFSLDKTRALLLAGCFAAAAILLFFAGSLSGILYSGHLGSHAATTRVVPAPALPKPMQAQATSHAAAPAPAASAAASPAVAAATATSAPAASGAATSTNTAAPATPAPAPEPPASAAASTPSATAATAPSSAPAVASAKPQPASSAALRPVEASYAIPLAVRVGSFSVKANAETLMQSLKDLGYRPALSLYSDPHGRTWYVVKLGPYTRWNKASQVAARVSIAENVRPVIGPMGPIQ